jgi:GH18 family chitinase
VIFFVKQIIDWEFPGDKDRGADPNSRENFNALVTEFRAAVNAESEQSGRRRLLITSAVASDPKKINNGYIVNNLCKQLDYVRFSLIIFSLAFEVDSISRT